LQLVEIWIRKACHRGQYGVDALAGVSNGLKRDIEIFRCAKTFRVVAFALVGDPATFFPFFAFDEATAVV